MALWEEPAFWSWAESLGELVLALDAEGRIVGCHHPTSQEFPLSPEEAKGKLLREVLPPSAAEALELSLEVLPHSKAPQRIEFQLTTGGRQRTYAAKIGVLFEAGKRIGALAQVSDVTDLALAQQARLESDAIYRLIAENATDVVTVKRLDGAYVYVSPSIETLTGIRPTEVLGKKMEDLWHPDDLARVSAGGPGELVPPPEGVRVHHRVRHLTQGWIWVESDARLIEWRGSSAVLCDTRDISRRRAAEERASAMLEEVTAARARAEAASEAKSEFLAGMSHSLRTPLHGILGMAELLAGTHLGEGQRQYLAAIQDSGRILLGMLTDLQDLSKIEAGELDLQNAPFDLVETVEGLADIVSGQAGQHGNELRCHVAQGVPSLVRGDPSRLRQVLINLLSTASKHTEGGEIAVEVKASPERGIRFRVSSTGMVAARDELQRAIAGRPQKDLGIAIARSLVELMGSELRARINDRGFSSVEFDLELEAASPEELQSLAQDLTGVRVLVGDGDAASRQVTRDALEAAGAEVEVASGGVEVIRTLQDGLPVRCLVLDAALPDIDGVSVASILHADSRFANLPIVIQASAELAPSLRSGKRPGVAVVLSRPVPADEIVGTIHTAIRGETGTVVDQSPGGSVLVVEDNDVNMRIARDLLRAAGYQVLGARSGSEALAQLERVPVDAVLMDIQLPDMDGLQATSLIRDQLGLREIPIIAMTAHAMKGDAERFLRAGLDDYLSKPVDRRELLAVLAREIVKRRGTAPA